jgi:hypothetical protein
MGYSGIGSEGGTEKIDSTDIPGKLLSAMVRILKVGHGSNTQSRPWCYCLTGVKENPPSEIIPICI